MTTKTSPSYQRVVQWLADAGHPGAPRWLEVPARTCAEAAAALGVQVGQIAKSLVFQDAHGGLVLVIASGDRRVDMDRLQALAGPVHRADAAFVKQQTGFSIGGVSPVAHLNPPRCWLDQDLQRFETIWAAAGHPHGVFPASPMQLARLTQAPWADVGVPDPAAMASAA